MAIDEHNTRPDQQRTAEPTTLATPPHNLGISIVLQPATPLTTLSDILAADAESPSLPGWGRFTPRNPIDKFNKAEMPPIHDAHPTAPLDAIDISVIKQWEAFPQGKLLAIPFENDAKKAINHDRIQAKIFAAAIDITQSQKIGVAGPNASANARQTPTTFLIYNIPDAQMHKLLKQAVWSSPAFTFRVTPFAPKIPKLLFTISKLTITDVDMVRKMITEIWKSDDALDFFNTPPRQETPQELNAGRRILEDLIESLDVQLLEFKERSGEFDPKFNIYAESPSITNHQVWSQARSFLATRAYNTTPLGPGRAQIAPFNCGICHGVDHPRGMCPFPNVTGWSGPTRRPETQRTRNEMTRRDMRR